MRRGSPHSLPATSPVKTGRGKVHSHVNSFREAKARGPPIYRTSPAAFIARGFTLLPDTEIAPRATPPASALTGLPPLVERGLGQASPMWRSTPRRTWCASTALQATTPASVALSHHQSLSDSGEPRPTPRATDSAIDPTRRIPFTKTNERAPREFPNFFEIAAVSY